MGDTTYRGKRWAQDRDKAILKISYALEEAIEELVSNAIQDYIDCEQFEENASEYCRKEGWREPA